jgi:hypothetical protein
MEATLLVPGEHDICYRCGKRPPPRRGYAVRQLKRPYELFCLPCGVALEWLPDDNELKFMARYPDGPRG